MFLPEAQTGEAWKPSTKQRSFGNGRASEWKLFSLLFFASKTVMGRTRGSDTTKTWASNPFWQRTKTVIAGWLASRTCTDYNARYTPRPVLLCNIHGLYKIYKNVAMDQGKQPRRSQFEHPYFVDWRRSGRKTSICAGTLVWGWKSTGSGETPVSGFCAYCNESSQFTDWAKRQPTSHEERILLSEIRHRAAAYMLTCAHELYVIEITNICGFY